jgi:hypothetical protein
MCSFCSKERKKCSSKYRRSKDLSITSDFDEQIETMIERIEMQKQIIYRVCLCYFYYQQDEGVYTYVIEWLSRNDNISNRSKLKRKYRHKLTWTRAK